MKYVIIIHGIVNMGGGQQYCSNKVCELKRRGYEVSIISSDSGIVILDSLKEYQGGIIPELRYSPICFSKKKRKRIINLIERIIGGIDQNTIIDSAGPSYSLWGEILAQKYSCKHVCMFIDESFSLSNDELAFLKFKHEHRELLGTSKKTFHKIFGDYYQVKNEEQYCFNPWNLNVVQDYNLPLIDEIPFGEYDFSIAIFSRLDKPFITPTLVSLIQYIENHRGKSFLIILVGGTERKAEERRILRYFDKAPNCKAIVTGFLFPVPRILFKRVDLFISSASSATVAASEGVPTIYVHCESGLPSGILNYDVFEGEGLPDLRYQGSNHSLSYYLDFVLFNKSIVLNRIPSVERNESTIVAESISAQLVFVNQNGNKTYYPVLSIRPSRIQMIEMILLNTLGTKMTDFLILQVVHRMKKRNKHY